MDVQVIQQLLSGGVIVNYFCTSRCRHCLYNCSPERSRDYMDSETAEYCFGKLASLGVCSVHIGGGEPLLRPDRLCEVLDAAQKAHVSIDYVETNSCWYRDEASACRTLERLRGKGVSCLLISISPFHLEYIPFARVLGVLKACEKTGVSVFPWMETFIPDFMALEKNKSHNMEALINRFGTSYLSGIRDRYWIHIGGRALDTFRPVSPGKPLEAILEQNPASCRAQLLDTSHFHVDLYKKYIPGLCSGLAMDLEDIGRPLSAEQYPLIRLLLERGVSGLFDLAQGLGFTPDRKEYLSPCDLCTDIRWFLSSNHQFEEELQPREFYMG